MRIIFPECLLGRFPSKAANRAKVWEKRLGFYATLKKDLCFCPGFLGMASSSNLTIGGAGSERYQVFEAIPEQVFHVTSWRGDL